MSHVIYVNVGSYKFVFCAVVNTVRIYGVGLLDGWLAGNRLNSSIRFLDLAFESIPRGVDAIGDVSDKIVAALVEVRVPVVEDREREVAVAIGEGKAGVAGDGVGVSGA